MAKFARPKSMVSRSRPDKTAAPDPKFQPFRRKEPEKVSSSNSSKKENSHSQSHSNSSSTSEKKPPVKKNINKSAPPPPSFAELMKMAKQAKSKPIPKISKISNGKEAEPDRPMTQKQREEYMREKNSQLRKSGKLPSTSHNASPENSSNSSKKSSSSGNSTSKSETHITSAASTSAANSNKTSPAGPSKENNFKQPCQKKNKPVIGKKHALKYLCVFTKFLLQK